MPLAILYSRAISGMEAPLVTVEVHTTGELSSFINTQAVIYFLTGQSCLTISKNIKNNSLEIKKYIPGI